MAIHTFASTNGVTKQSGSLYTFSDPKSSIQLLNSQSKAASNEAAEAQNNGGFLGGVGYLFEKVGLGFLSGIEGIWDYGAGGIAKLFGADDWAEQQFSNDLVNYSHADEWFNPSEGWQVAGDVAGGIGTSLPAIAGVAAGAAIAYFSGGTLSPLAAGIISSSIAGLGAAGNATKEAYKQSGELGAKEFGYGFLSGATEAGVEILTAGMAKGSGRIVSSIAKATAKETAETVVKTGAKTGIKSIIKDLGQDFISEAIEEGLAEMLDPVYQRMTFNPDAENATPQEVAYAALVGGLSGLVMSGGSTAISAGVNTTQNLFSGSKAIENGTVESIMETARQLTDTENANDTGYASFQTVKNAYEQLSESLKTTGGTVQTVKQKMLLGQIKRANTASIFMPFIERSAVNILANAESVAQRYSEFGMKDANGKPLTLTADDIRSGVDATLLQIAPQERTREQQRALVKSIRTALTSNSTLATLAVADATGRITMDTQRFAEAALIGANLANSADLNYFVEHASKEQIAALSADLGISDWSALTIDDFRAKVSEFATSEKISEYAQQSKRIRAAMQTAQESAKPIPHILRRNMSDGVYRFTSENSAVNMAVFKEGETYHLFDYESGNISRSLTVQEVNKVLRTFWNSNTVQTPTVEQAFSDETNLGRQALDIDAMARKQIPEYHTLSEPNKQAVRMTIRQAQAHGIAEAETLTFARVAARSGMNIVFDGAKSAVGDANIQGNTIYINPNAPKERLQSRLLLHEAGHALLRSKDGKNLIAAAFKHIAPERSQEIAQRYINFYKKQGMSMEQYMPIVNEEITTAYIEDVLGDANAWEYILGEDPSLSEKVLSFFRKAAKEYSADEKLSAEARKLLRTYKKLFADLSAQNQGNNALELTRQDAQKKKAAKNIADRNAYRYAMVDVDLLEFADSIGAMESKTAISKRKHSLGKISEKHAKIVEDVLSSELGLNIDAGGYTVNIDGSAIKHIAEKHGVNGSSDHSMANLTDVARIGWAVNNADSGYIARTQSGEFDYSTQFRNADGTPSPKIILEKSIGDGLFVIAECVPDTAAKKIHIISARKIKSDNGQVLNVESDVSPQPTSETLLDGITATDSITEKEQKVNRNSEISSDGRYALSIGGENVAVDVEEGKDLIAIHNLTEQNLIDTLELGGFPMPSIAIVRKGQDHSNYGNISVIFGKDTIDPQASPDNKVYGSDAWTPTASNARTEYKVDYDKLRTIETRLEELSKKVAGGAFTSTSIIRRIGIEDVSEHSAERIAERLANSDEVRAAYLASLGRDVEPEYKTKVYNKYGNEALQTFINKVGVQRLASLSANIQLGERDSIRAEAETVRQIIRDTYAEQHAYFLNRKPEIKEQRIDAYMEKNVFDFTIEDFIDDAWQYYQEGGAVTEEIDRLATSDKLRQAVEDSEVRDWLIPQISEFLGERGVYNGADFFDKKGRSRSFEETHYEYTVENIVRAMKNNASARGEGTFGANANSIVATATPSYSSIEEMHADKGRLKTEDQATYDAILRDIDTILKSVEHNIMSTNRHHSDNSFDEEQIIGGIITDAATGKRTIAAVQKAFAKEGYTVSAVQAKKVLDLYEKAAQIPTGYFEAKPERVVEFSEIKMVELPASASETLKSKLTERNIPFEVYGNTDAERATAIDNLEDVRFALSDESYMQAVEAGDNDAMRGMLDKAAKKAGYTIRAYHGTNNREEKSRWNAEKRVFDTEYSRFTVFKQQYDEQNGFFFSDDQDNAGSYGGTVYDAYLRLRRPLEIDCKNQTYNAITHDGQTMDTYDWAEYARKNKYDGVIFKNIRDGAGYGEMSKASTDYVVFKSEQIKSADLVTYDDAGNVIPLSSRFKSTHKDIRFALPETDSEGNALSAGQREYFADSKVLDENGNLLLVYHGTRRADFTEFRRNVNYFTDSAEMADSYSPNGEKYSGYLNITNPYIIDAGGEKWSRIPVDDETKQFLDERGSSTFEEDGAWRTTPADIAAAIEEAVDEGEMDYDGIIIRNVDDTGSYSKTGKNVVANDYIAFRSNQFKNADNANPTADRDIRHALPDEDLDALFDDDADGSNSAQDAAFDAEAVVARGMPRTAGKSSLTVGELRKIIANNTKQKVYSKQDALSVVGRFAGISDLTQKTRTEIADAVWQILNESPDVEYRRDVAHDMAEFIVAKIIVDAKTENPDALEAQERLSYLRTGIGKLSFSEEDMSEIRHVRDKKGLKQVLGRWGYKGAHKGAGGIVSSKRTPMDVFVVDIAREMPAMEYLEEMHPVDAFLEIDSLYERALAEAKDKWISAYWDMPDSEIPSMIKSVEDEIMRAYETEGEQSKFSRMVENKIGYYSERAEYWKAEYDKIKGRDRLLGLLMSKAQKMKDLKLGTFANSTQHDSEIFKNSIEQLARIQFRGNLNLQGTRGIIADLLKWYTSKDVKENMLGYIDESNAGLYVQGVADMMEFLTEDPQKKFSKDDLKMLYDVMSYFTNFVENWGKVFRQGKWIEAKPEAERYINTLHANESLKVGLFSKLAGTTYMQTFGDPMTVARRMDMYESGFYTEMMQELRDAAVDAQVAEMEMRSAYEEFTKKHKKYVEKATIETVTYRGTEIPKMHLIGLYMTMKRKHAWAGLAANGFTFTDTKGKRVRVNGVVSPEAKITAAELEQLTKDQLSAIEALLTDTDKEYIAILEQAYNVDARKLKADRDMQRLGFTNATNDYYYPIRRGNIAKNVDTADIAGELDRVSNSSFNKDTVRGAKQELFIESADAVFNRHIHAVCQYAYLSPAVEAYNRLYNLDISGNKNKPISVATESANTWDKGNKYFVKLISDIQGIPATSSEGMKALGFIRGSYAKFQLGANPKVWFTQLSSIFASSSLLDADSITRGMAVSAKGMDEYCSLAKLRNNDNTAAMAQGVLDSRAKRAVGAVSKFSDLLMSPIGKMDRFVVGRLFGACQVQVAKNGGAKVGTEANKVEAGKLLRRVILETQQNAVATERSAAMRSGNEIMRTLTMFTSDSMKVVGRVIDAVGEVATLKSKLKATTDADTRAALKQQLKAANRKARKAVGALCLTAVFMASIAQLFRWLYDKEQDEDESVAETMLVDAVGNLFGGLPLFKDAYAKIFEGYDVDNYAYSAINDLLDSALNLFEVAGNILTNEGSAQDRNRAMRNLAYSVGQMFGIPVRNVYNVFFGLTKRFNPEAAYVIDNAFYEKNYQNELYKAIEEDDAEMTSFIMSLLLGERMNENVDEAVFNELLILSKNGQKVIPRSVPSKITIDEVEYPLSAAEQAAIKDIYATSERSLKALFAKSKYSTLSDEQKAEAIDFIYDTYYDKALEGALGIDRGNNSLIIADVVGVDNLALLYVTTKGLTSDTDRRGNVISGSKRKKVVAAINSLGVSTEKKLLLICAKGYSLQDNDIRGLSAAKAKKYLLRYILSLKGKTKAEKAEIAELCGFEVVNGRIVTKNL